MMPLRTEFALGFDLLWPVNDQTVARAAVAASDLLRPGEWRVSRHGPAGGVVTVGIRPTEIVDVLENLWNGFYHAVEVGHLIEQAVHTAFGTRAVVTDDVEDERVVQLVQVFDGLNE